MWNGIRYTFACHSTYGSLQLEKADVEVTAVKFSNDDGTAEVEVNELKPALVYDFELGKLKAKAGSGLLNPHIAYTVRKIPK